MLKVFKTIFPKKGDVLKNPERLLRDARSEIAPA